MLTKETSEEIELQSHASTSLAPVYQAIKPMAQNTQQANCHSTSHKRMPLEVIFPLTILVDARYCFSTSSSHPSSLDTQHC
jgi:hypothetical protein